MFRSLLAVFAAAMYAPAQTREAEILTEYTQFLSIPNVASDAANIRRNADAIVKMYARRGVNMRLLEAAGAPPAVYGEIVTPGAARTILLYAHYDGQPVDPKDWTVTEPFRPLIRGEGSDRRIYARSASDDKAPIMAIAVALDEMRQAGTRPRSNIKFFFEGEEEAGSPHLGDVLRANRNLLKADVWLICDGPVHQSGRQQIPFGVRGIVLVDLTVYGPSRELHSGHYGNWAPNPAMMLARLLATMKDDDGRVLIDRWYDGIEALGKSEREAIAAEPDIDSALRHELGLARTEGGGRRLLELITFPSLNIRGLASAGTGAVARNVIPSTATAEIDIRLVKGIEPATAVERLTAHVGKQGYHVIAGDPDASTRLSHPRIARIRVRRGGYNAVRTPMDLPIARDVIAAVAEVRAPVVRIPNMGGSVPLAIIEEILGVPTIGVPIANHDNNQHSSDENLRLQNLWDGVRMMKALLTLK